MSTENQYEPTGDASIFLPRDVTPDEFRRISDLLSRSTLVTDTGVEMLEIEGKYIFVNLTPPDGHQTGVKADG